MRGGLAPCSRSLARSAWCPALTYLEVAVRAPGVLQGDRMALLQGLLV